MDKSGQCQQDNYIFPPINDDTVMSILTQKRYGTQLLTALRRQIFSRKDPRQPNILMQNIMTPTTRRKKAGSVAKLSNEPSLAFCKRAQMPMITKHIPPT